MPKINIGYLDLRIMTETTNRSGSVTNVVFDAIITNLNQAGYYDADTNCSGIVTNSDKDPIVSNLNKATKVSE